MILSELTQNLYGSIPDSLRLSKDRQCYVLYAKPGMSGTSFCALGTLAHNAGESPLKIILGLQDKTKIYHFYGVKRNETKKQIVKCPDCGARCRPLGLIAHLNDTHKLKWGDIADRLESVQAYDTSQPKINQLLDTLKTFIGAGKLTKLLDSKFYKTCSPSLHVR